MNTSVIEEEQGIDAVVQASLPATTEELQAALAAANHRSSGSAVLASVRRLRLSGLVIERMDGAYDAAIESTLLVKYELRRVRDLATRVEALAAMYPTPDRLDACRLLQAEKAVLERKARRAVLLQRRDAIDAELLTLA
jgi:hypothetical protein